MDGTAGVTQCPIAPNSSFQYSFSADVAGTYWYHSHLGKFINVDPRKKSMSLKATNTATDFEEL